MKLRAPSLPDSMIGRHLVIYGVGAGVVQIAMLTRSVLDRVGILTAPPCPTCSVAQLPAQQDDTLPEPSPAYDEGAPSPFAGDELSPITVDAAGEATPTE